ncbi:phosphoribosyltransferase [Iodidimonas sp. SYSU 1G8]|uniref:phosphoribosyltransferase n=1 Tax=Iodidimonas sp. SYSU 1G8 TaxID=3133967 RepID=UPI0031FEE22B
MQYRSFRDLATLINRQAHRINRMGADIVLGIPRSGMYPALVMSSLLNKPVADLDGFIAGHVMSHGKTRALPGWSASAGDYRTALVVDDSVHSGAAASAARKKLQAAFPELKVIVLAVYGSKDWAHHVDDVLETCPFPRIFEWNMLHSWVLEKALFDLDGVFCRDPDDSENDDGDRYRQFLRETQHFALPGGAVRGIVTSRLERYRPETEAWLADHGVKYRHLHMLDLPSAAERRRLGAHAKFKADVYRGDPDALLFVESEPAQAREITRRSGKPVLDYRNMVLASPDKITPGYQYTKSSQLLQRIRRALVRRVRIGRHAGA